MPCVWRRVAIAVGPFAEPDPAEHDAHDPDSRRCLLTALCVGPDPAVFFSLYRVADFADSVGEPDPVEYVQHADHVEPVPDFACFGLECDELRPVVEPTCEPQRHDCFVDRQPAIEPGDSCSAPKAPDAFDHAAVSQTVLRYGDCSVILAQRRHDIFSNC